ATRACSRLDGAEEPAGQRLAIMDPPRSRRPGVCSPHGWRSAPQNARSRGPPEHIRRKAQPETEGIETSTAHVRLRSPEGLDFAKPSRQDPVARLQPLALVNPGTGPRSRPPWRRSPGRGGEP